MRKKSKSRHITVLGDGGWGTALSLVLNGKGHKVTLWGAFKENIQKISEKKENSTFLPGVHVPVNINLTTNMGKALKNAEIVIISVPSHVFRLVCKKYKRYHKEKHIIVSVAKGLESKTLLRMSEVIEDTIGSHADVVALSGPSHAEEVARGIPTAIVASSKNPKLAAFIEEVFTTNHFKVYTNPDLIGVELGGTLKNIIAITAGIVDGLKLGANTKAAVLTRGLVEISRLGVRMGANPLTFSGLSGIGDLITTGLSPFSRNRTLGERIGKGENLEAIIASTPKVAEGVNTIKAALTLAKKYNVAMPITEELYKVLKRKESPKKLLSNIFSRDSSSELDWLPFIGTI
ncbi:MAG: NAD(P)-dependent glycerol-3-phosphate dehydrogenase [Candidatus Aureabacteria bacterium]|nr:NAD(P)-dependent glycerol-3-phosphate dehydrogenase [Candidatus Auribacterota bacterium]